MREPGNHTAWIDKFGDTWVRDDDVPDTGLRRRWGPWFPLSDGPGWDEGGRNKVGTPRPWHQVDPTYAPFTQADAVRTAWALELVREAYRDD